MKKLTIHGYKKAEKIGGSADDVFICQINPESIKHNRTVEVDSKSVGDTAGSPAQFKSYGAETLDFDFYLDATGAIPGLAGTIGTIVGVDMQIDQMLNVCYNYDGGEHKPLYLRVEYGHIDFVCLLKSCNVDYTLFKRDGTPLRAKISLSFTEYQSNKQRAMESGKQSPDMTHSITVREGDSLPLMCRDVYGSMNYYLQVAEHNGLTNFRELEVGETLIFPPLER